MPRRNVGPLNGFDFGVGTGASLDDGERLPGLGIGL
jgi:hypothetical protein